MKTCINKTPSTGWMRLTLLLLLLVIFTLPPGKNTRAAGSTIFVRAGAVGTNDGTSWADAFTGLQPALSAAVSGDEIWVAAGTYTPGTNRADTFQLKNGVAIYGGFAGTETLRSQRSPKVNLALLSGDIGFPSIPDDNSFHVVTSSSTNETAVLDGFTITAGDTLGDVVQPNGGGILNLNGSPTLSNLVISRNNASFGGGMYSSGNSSPVLTNITFRRNTADWAAGMYTTLNSNAILTSVTFDQNAAEARGGGMLISDSSPLLTNVTFYRNTASTGGGLQTLNGGNPTLMHATFNGNIGMVAGGAIYNQDSSPVISSSILYGNSVDEIFNLSGTTTVTNSIVQGGYGEGNLDANPLLGPLQDNGGFTQTLALAAGSPALDLAESEDCPDTDQQGISRPQGASSDLGAYELDTVAPTVHTVSSTAANGAYGIGESLSITVTFSEAVVVTGNPQLTLETGSLDRTATYSGGSGTDTLAFSYTVQAGDMSSDLDYGSSSALVLNGGTIQDAVNNHAGLTLPVPGENGSLAASRDIVVDGVIPRLLSITRQNPVSTSTSANALVFRVTFSEAVTLVDASDFEVNGTTAAMTKVTAVNAGTYDLTLSGGDLYGLNGQVGLDLSPARSVQDLAGNVLSTLDPSIDETYLLDNPLTPLSAGWVGSVSVTSDRNVVAVGRPHIGSEVASFNGFADGSLTAYVPMLFKNAYGTYNSALYVQNVHASDAAHITIKFYNSTGNQICTKTDSIASLSSKGYWIASESCLPEGWAGGAVVTSDQPIVAVGRPHVGSEVTTYNGFTAGSLTSYIPMLFNNYHGYNAAFYVQNIHNSNTANITIKYYNSSGTLNCTRVDTVAPLASKGYWVPSAACDSGSIPTGWVGGVVVTSDQPIVGIGRPHIGSQVTTYNGFTAGSLSSYVPMLFNNYNGYNAALYVQNVHADSTARVTIKYYSSTGVLNCTRRDTIAPLATKGYWLPSTTCDTGSLPPGWSGAAVVTSDQPVVAVGRPHIGTQVTTYNGFSSGNLNSYLPMLFKSAFSNTYNSAFYLQNTGTGSAVVTIKFYNTTGALTCTRQDTIPALSTLGYWLPGVTCNP